jgi:superfamily II DNA or RNA helicase
MAARKQPTPLTVGDWVIVKNDPHGRIGPWQVVKINGDNITVVTGSHPDSRFDLEKTLLRKDLQRIAEKVGGLSVWWPMRNHKAWGHGIAVIEQEDHWLVLPDAGKEMVRIKYRNGLLNDGEKSLWVKDFRSIPEPFQMLRFGMSTRMKELNVGRAFRKWMNEQIHASVGFSAVMAAPIRPAHHQLNAMARVLGDPTLRFLLADEVGLGKTIEASLILKQLFLDGAISNAIIAVPRALKLQWKRELENKLSLSDLIQDGKIEILAHEDFNDTLKTDLLIVDEAHRFCRGERSESLYSDLEKVSQRITRLILVSATPMRSEPFMLLQLLHLIDHKNYELNDEVEFRKRLDIRVKQSNALRLLKPSTPEAQRRYFAQTLRDNTPKDQKLEELLYIVENSETDSDQLSEALQTLRTEIEERFRISRRLVRNRRSSIDQEDYPLSGRSHEIIELDSGNLKHLNEFLEDWRYQSREKEWHKVEPVFTSLLEHVLGGTMSIQMWLDQRLNELKNSPEKTKPIFETEKNLLEQYRVLLAGPEGLSQFFIDYFEPVLTRQVGENVLVQKTVICTGFTDRAEIIFADLYKRFGPRVVAHFESKSDEENDAAIQKFSSEDDVRLLIIDGSAEEGLNLQIARTIINIDLPWSVNRLEQRFGRLDRFADGHSQNAVCKVLVHKENELLSKYVEFLRIATGIFEESVATAQKSLAQVLRESALEVWVKGVRDADLKMESVKDRINEEKEEVEELEDIESESSFGDFPLGSFKQLQLFEEQWAESKRVLDKVTTVNGGLGIHRVPLVRDSQIFKFKFSNESRIPAILQLIQKGSLSERATFNRPLAMNHPGTEMLRIGNPMVRYFEDFFSRDDLGKVSVGWLKDNDMAAPFIDFSLEVLVTPDFDFLKELIPPADFHRVQRRIGTSLQPQLLELRVDENADSITAESHVWNSETHLVVGEDLITLLSRRGSFAEALDLLEEKLPSLVWNQLEGQILEAISSANSDSERRINSLKIWQSGNVNQEIELEEQIAEEIDHGLRNPKIRLLSLVVVIHSYEEFQ